MFAMHFISDAAVSQPMPPRGGLGLQRSHDQSAVSRRTGFIASLRALISAHTPGELASSRGAGR